MTVNIEVCPIEKKFSKKFEKLLDKTTNLWYNKDVDREEPSKDAIWTVRA